MSRPRVVVAGLGDSGLLTAIHLSRHCDVVGISAKPGLVSGQELGIRLSSPDEWAEQYWVPFDKYRRLDRVRTVHGALTGLDLDARQVTIEGADGSTLVEDYDVLVVSTGVTNGFWRQPVVQSADEVDAALRADHERIAAASSVAVVGGGAAAVGTAANVAARWPDKQVDLYFPGERAIPSHHGRAWGSVREILEERGVGLHPGHRAVVPDDADQITKGPVEWSTGQPPAGADAVVWAIGRVRPNTGWLPAELLDDDGFVRVTPELQLPGHPEVFAIGDVAATDPLRSSARNRADRVLARNIRAHLRGRRLKSYHPPRRRWGSVIGTQENGLTVYAPNGYAFRFPHWSIRVILRGLITRLGIYKGVRSNR
ncbi:FAD-dependent oxidoreductase [Aeromicrobium terrae]|uniref:Pyridine nucleotide-disulfide oxidoreductase n=1 Tax=Aeromicrobium terrae TaxID=2498846 RepID=A0A5C8NI13_9ACTN|nr:FAD-dependent oxidoreductase [Aeromicrobium terrae]TXL60790.1 pyridine nucleotide-disulfide oxidoreductase [Aeromicrobium terrae]